ncbi:hypothetical protein BJX66DRAFT_240995 [Aspergillus keveii]|uniref:Uncharacterized protein n=1 Tax=Aspergillus keveii TaxID=714993 RepID=A0ABR4GK80_9EURO
MAIKRSESPAATASGGELWNPEDAHRLLELRVLHAELTWEQFHKLGFFPGRTLHSLRRKHDKLTAKAARARQLSKASYRASTGSVPVKRPLPNTAPYPARSVKRSRSETRGMGSRTRLGNSSKAIGYRESSLRSFSSIESADERRNDADGYGGDIDFDGSTRRLRRGLRSQGTDSDYEEPPQDVTRPESTSTPTTTRPQPASGAPSRSNSRHGSRVTTPSHNKVPSQADHEPNGPEHNRAPQGVDLISLTKPAPTLPLMRLQSNPQQSPRNHSLPPMARLIHNPTRPQPSISVQLSPLQTIRPSPLSKTTPSLSISEGRFATVQSCPPATLASPAQRPPASRPPPEKIPSPNRIPAQDQQNTRERSVSPARFLRDAAATLLQRADVLEQQKAPEANKRAELEAENTRLRKQVEELVGAVKKGETELEQLRKEMEDKIAVLNKNVGVLQEELEKYGKLKDVLKTLI